LEVHNLTSINICDVQSLPKLVMWPNSWNNCPALM